MYILYYKAPDIIYILYYKHTYYLYSVIQTRYSCFVL